METVHGLTVTEINAIAVMLGVVAITVVFCWQPTKIYLRGMQMKKERRENIHNFLLGRLVDIVEEDVANGHLTRREAEEEIYTPFKRVFYTQKDLWPIPEKLKEVTKKRMQNGLHEPVTLPPVKRKNMLGR